MLAYRVELRVGLPLLFGAGFLARPPLRGPPSPPAHGPERRRRLQMRDSFSIFRISIFSMRLWDSFLSSSAGSLLLASKLHSTKAVARIEISC